MNTDFPSGYSYAKKKNVSKRQIRFRVLRSWNNHAFVAQSRFPVEIC